MLLAVWEYYLSHFTEINWAIIFALFFAVLMDFIQPASKLMAVRRHIMNKLAEQSVASLRVRIAQAQGQRDQVANYLASDKALYLSVVKYVLGIVLMLSAAAAVVLLGHLGIMRGPYELLALAPVLMSIVLCSVRHSHGFVGRSAQDFKSRWGLTRRNSSDEIETYSEA